MSVNVSIDVDLTLIDKDGQLLPGAVEAIEKLLAADCKITLWSLAGAEYAKSVAVKYKIEHLFVGFAAKPDVIIDDDLDSIHPSLKFEMKPDTEWKNLVEKVLEQVKNMDGKVGDQQTLESLVNDCQDQLAELRVTHANLFAPNPNLHLHPAPFFGNPLRAEVLTVALNPSYPEFDEVRGWEEQLTSQELTVKLLSYFHKAPSKWHTWFNKLEKALLYFNSSYETNAAHVDLFPHPTLWLNQLGNEQRNQLAGLINANHLRGVLKLCRSVKLLIVIDYTVQFNGNRRLSTFALLKETFPFAVESDGNTFPAICFSGPDVVAERIFGTRHLYRDHLRSAEPINFETRTGGAN